MNPIDIDSFIDLLKGIRAVRKYSDQPVSPAAITKILRAATFAPNARNTQPWHFIVITDSKVKQAIKEIVWPAQRAASETGRLQPRETLVDSAGRSVTGDASADNIAQVPVLIIACWDSILGSGMKEKYHEKLDIWGSKFGSLYPAIENMLIASRILGMASLLTTAIVLAEDQIKSLLEIPKHIEIVGMVYLGYSAEGLGNARRRPPAEVAHLNGWNGDYVEANF